MCGIGAVLDPEASLAPGAPAAMAAALRHRGPDGESIRSFGPAHLVHTRLAIIDVAGGDQPLASEDGMCHVVVNGEIYNHGPLRAELESAGHRFATRSDSEVVVHLYEQDGLDGLRRLNGMFAFALWDARPQRLVVARDPLGVKPLYWWTDGRRVVASSEIGALLAASPSARAVDPVALEHFLTWRFVPAPRTLLAGVRKLAAAEMLVADADGVRVTSYRRAPGAPVTGSADELAGELGRRLTDAVQRQMMSDVPYGAFLSGGVDSAAIVAAMARAGEGPPSTFTIGFPGHGSAVDERNDAEASAMALGARYHADVLDEAAFPALVDRCVARLEEPCGIPSAPALLQLSAFARREVKVALSGQGADEPLGGYTRHQAMAALWLVHKAPEALRRPVRGLAGLVPRAERLQRAAALVGQGDARDALLRIFDITPPELRRELSAGPADEAAAERRALADGVLADVEDRDLLEQGLYLDTHLFLPDGLLIYGDKMSMAHGLEQRVPFLDLELLRFVERVPASLRVHRGRRKWLYRRALTGLLPEAIIGRPKRSFSTPYDEWLRASLGEEVARRFGPGAPAGELIDGTVVARLVDEHRRGRADRKRLLYCLLELARWHELFVAGSVPPAAVAAGDPA